MKTHHLIPEFQATGLVTAGISLRCGGVSEAPYGSLNLGEHVGDDRAAVRTNRKILSQQVCLKALHYCSQVHGDTVINVDDTSRPSVEGLPEADALVTSRGDVALGIFTADCVPIFILDPATPAIGLAHAGWRGTFAEVAAKTLAHMRTHFGTAPGNCLIHLGPAIQKCCYTVSDELLTQFTDRFGSTVRKGRNLDLHAANVCQLMAAGVPVDSISLSAFCTACRTDLFYSHRAENGHTGRMLSFIQCRAEN